LTVLEPLADLCSAALKYEASAVYGSQYAAFVAYREAKLVELSTLREANPLLDPDAVSDSVAPFWFADEKDALVAEAAKLSDEAAVVYEIGAKCQYADALNSEVDAAFDVARSALGAMIVSSLGEGSL
jgi:hypothetical protein